MYYIFATSNKQRREIKWSRCNMMPRCFSSGISSNMRERSFLPSAVSGWRQRRSSTGSGRLWSVLLRPSVAGRCAICCSESLRFGCSARRTCTVPCWGWGLCLSSANSWCGSIRLSLFSTRLVWRFLSSSA